MIKQTITLLTSLIIVLSASAQEAFSVKLSGQIFNFPGEEMELIQNKGNGQDEKITSIKVDKKGNFSKKVELKDQDYYMIKLPDGQQLNLIIEDQEEIKIYGDGKNLFFHSNVIGSEPTTALNEFLRYNFEYKAKLDSATLYLKENPGKRNEINQAFQPTFEAYKGYRQRFIAENAKSPALVGVLNTFNLDTEFAMYEKVVNELNEGFPESPTVQRIVIELEANRKKIEANKPLGPGSQAKEIALPNPQGDTLRLSDYKGKTVLIDFWASWCGPCRRENPNVVKMYDKYHSDGFEVFSVSLDKNKERWVAAIEQDNLKWDGHVSDLKFWSSEAARAYNVSSIPFTLLIDKDGKVIATNLRGAQLEEVLRSIYGH